MIEARFHHPGNGSKRMVTPAESRRSVCGVLAMAMILPLLAAAGCKKEAPPETVVTVQAEHPEQGPIAEHISSDAVLAPQAQAAITPKITAPVKKFYVQRGAHVKAGELLAELEDKDLAGAALDSKGGYVAAQAAFQTATKAQVPEDAQKAELDLAQAKANLELNQAIVKGRKQLLAEGAIPGRDLDTAQAALVQAQAAYDTAAAHAESMRKVTRDAELQTAQGQLTSAEGKYRNAAAMAGYAEIRSPIDGVVTDRPLYAGEMPAAGVPLITVMDTSVLTGKAHIAQAVSQRLKLGDEVAVLAPGVDKPVPAKISLISPALDPGSTTVEIWVKIENKKGDLKVGTPVKLSITGRSDPQAWKVPVSAVQTAQDGSKFAMVVGSDGAAHKKAVTLGIQDGDDVQVVSGLSPSDNVITGGAYALDEGTKVKVGAADDADKAGGAADDKKPAAGGKD